MEVHNRACYLAHFALISKSSWKNLSPSKLSTISNFLNKDLKQELTILDETLFLKYSYFKSRKHE